MSKKEKTKNKSWLVYLTMNINGESTSTKIDFTKLNDNRGLKIMSALHEQNSYVENQYYKEPYKTNIFEHDCNTPI